MHLIHDHIITPIAHTPAVHLLPTDSHFHALLQNVFQLLPDGDQPLLGNAHPLITRRLLTYFACRWHFLFQCLLSIHFSSGRKNLSSSPCSQQHRSTVPPLEKKLPNIPYMTQLIVSTNGDRLIPGLLVVRTTFMEISFNRQYHISFRRNVKASCRLLMLSLRKLQQKLYVAGSRHVNRSAYFSRLRGEGGWENHRHAHRWWSGVQ